MSDHPRGRARVLSAAVLAAVIALGGCSAAGERGRSPEPSGTPGGGTTAAAAPLTGEGAAGSPGPGAAAADAARAEAGGARSGGGAPGTSIPTGEVYRSGPVAASRGGSASGSAVGAGGFCGAQRTLEARLRSLDAGAGPARLGASVASARAAFPPALGTAPPEVAGDLQVVADAYSGLFAALEQADFDVSRVSVGAVQGLSPSALGATSDRLRRWVAAAC